MKHKSTRILILVTLELNIDGFNQNKEAPTLKPNFPKLGTCQRQHSFTLAYQTPFQNQGSRTCVASLHCQLLRNETWSFYFSWPKREEPIGT